MNIIDYIFWVEFYFFGLNYILCFLIFSKVIFNFLNAAIFSALSKIVHCPVYIPLSKIMTHLDETSHMSAEFVFRYGPKCMGGLILPIIILLHL